MVGGIKQAARSAFASSLLAPLELKEKQLVQLEALDDGVSGYVFDLLPLRIALLADKPQSSQSALKAAASLYRPIDNSITDSFVSLIQASLQDLPVDKPRLVNTALSPHEILVLIRDIGIDLFDTYWAQRAATWGVALDFRFPARTEDVAVSHINSSEKKQLGINIFDTQFATSFVRLAENFVDRLEYSKQNNDLSPEDASGQVTFCACAACSPIWPNNPLIHSSVDEGTTPAEEPCPPYTRAYIHHLLHTHEMSAHSLLAMHNITVMDAFMRGVRSVLQHEPGRFADEVMRFQETYDGSLKFLEEAKLCCAEVNLARGKGRMARERECEASKNLESLAIPVPSVVDSEIGIQG
jgi:queuine tRNA-ribosyltransferase